jgi:hypothetical protein
MRNEMIFLDEHNLFLNLSDVIDAEFIPAHEFIDNEQDPAKTYQIDDRMVLTTKTLEVEKIDGFDGTFLGAASKNATVEFEGATARRLFNLLYAHSENLSSYSDVLSGPNPGDVFPF